MKEILVFNIDGSKFVPVGEVHKLIQAHAERVKLLENQAKLQFDMGYTAAVKKLRDISAIEYRSYWGEVRAARAQEWADWLENNKCTR